jgi:RNA-binding protein YhbY
MTTNLIPSGLKEKFWLVSADMGYGHQRAIYPLRLLAYNRKILNANTSTSALVKEKRLWNEMLRTYEFMSRAGRLPIIGALISSILDTLLYIPKFYPLKDRSNSTIQVRYLKSYIKKGLCNGILNDIGGVDIPLITSFYSSAIAADISGHRSVYCIICDTDINRVWVAEEASQSHIMYFASGTISAQRLISYGVPEKNILLTGFPLPLELLGDRKLNILRSNLKRRLINLDPDGLFDNLYKHSVKAFLPDKDATDIREKQSITPLTITFAVGGAGAQKEIAREITFSLADRIRKNQIKLNLVAGTRKELREYFEEIQREIPGSSDNIQIIWEKDNESYFETFNQCLQTTDILWTKPSELSFYCALGIPIILTPAIGPQEKCNRKWLREIGAGIKQQNPEYTNQWLFDLLKKGRLAEAAWNGFLKARKYGTYNIIDFLESGTFVSSNDPLKR